MMHNLRIVFEFEFIHTVKRKSFWLTTLIFPAMIGLIFAISYFSGKSADDVSHKADKQQFTLMVLDNSGLISPPVLRGVKAQSVETKEAGVEAVRSGRVDAFFLYPANPVKNQIEAYGHDVGLTKNEKYSAVAQQLLQSSVAESIGSPEKIALIKGSSDVHLSTYAAGKKTPGVERVIAPGIYLILFYMVIVLLGNQMLSSTTEEKENRVIEMILTTVASRPLIIGKILAMMAAGLVQVAVILLPTVIGYIFFRDSLNIPNVDLTKLIINPAQMIVGGLIFMGGFLVFTGMLVAIGAAMPTAKEANRFFGVAIFLMFVPLYAAAAIVTDPSQLIVKIFSFFPLFAPITLMLRNAVANLSPVETIGGVAVLLVSGVIALAIAIRSFRYGALQYSRKLTLRDVFGRTR